MTTSAHTVTASVALYPSPTVTGGTQPVSLTCTPESGSVFSKGTTSVTCTATDAIQRQATCSLTVTVDVPAPPIPLLQGTKFLAFGDSLTKGENGCNIYCAENIDYGYEYPTLLQALLAARYTQQAITVRESGQGGETAAAGTYRLRAELQSFQPDALLLLEGVNEFFFGESPVAALRVGVRMAKDAGVKVFLATLPPQIPGMKRAWGVAELPTVNAMIRDLASQEQVVLVDVFEALNTNVHQYVSSPEVYEEPNEADGLHLTRAGRIKLAETFFEAIKANFEVKETGTTSATSRLKPIFRRPGR